MWTVLRFVRTVRVITFKISYVQEMSAQVSQIVFPAHLTVLRVITTVWSKTSKIWYLRDFSVQILQIVFSVHLTVLRLITTKRAKTSKNSYLTEFSAQISQIVFWRHLTVLRLITTVWKKTFKMSNLRVLSAQGIANRVLNSLYRFTAFYNILSINFKSLISPWVQSTCVTNRVSSPLTFLRLITTVWAKTLKISYLREFNKQVSQIVFSAHLTVLWAY